LTAHILMCLIFRIGVCSADGCYYVQVYDIFFSYLSLFS
jgi:hypothetical protein